MAIWACDGWVGRSLLALLGALIVTMIVCWLAPLHPLFEVVTNIRAQLIPLTLVPVVGLLALQRWPLLGVAAVVLVVNAAYLVPYWAASPDPGPAGADTITVMQYNIFFGNNDHDAIVTHILETDADVVVLHELLPEQWSALDERLDEYPYRIAVPLAETDGQPGGGMALLSRAPLKGIDMGDAVSPVERVTLAAMTVVNGEPITVIGLHPHASRTDSVKIQLRERQLNGVAALVNANERPAIVLTDLNVAPTSPVYQDFLNDMGWRDPHRIVGWQSSWPAWGGSFGMPIDHVLVSDHFVLHSYQTGDGAGSDHKSVTAEISLVQSQKSYTP